MTNTPAAWDQLGSASTGVLVSGAAAAVAGAVAGLMSLPVLATAGVVGLSAFLADKYLGKEVWDHLVKPGVGALLDGLFGAFDRLNSTNTYKIVYVSDPLVLDLDGNGIQTVAANGYKGAVFDHNGGGIATATGWVGPGDGFLVRDVNGNGRIDNGSEMFGDQTKLPGGGTATGGFAALAGLDDNNDKVVNSLDKAFNELRVWRDVNQDGVSDKGEIFSLQELGISALNVEHQVQSPPVVVDGGSKSAIGSYVREDGTVAELADVTLTVDTFHSSYTTDLPIPVSLQSMPEVEGMGRLRDLRQAASLSSDLADVLVKVNGAETRTEQRDAIDKLLVEWSKTDPLYNSGGIVYHPGIGGSGSSASINIVYLRPGQTFQFSSDGGVRLFDDVVQKIRVVEAFRGGSLANDLWAGAGDSVQTYLSIYDEIKDMVGISLAQQTRLEPYFDAVEWTYTGGQLSLDYSGMFDLLDSRFSVGEITTFTDLAELLDSFESPGVVGELTQKLGHWLISAQDPAKVSAVLDEFGIVIQIAEASTIFNDEGGWFSYLSRA